MDSGLSRLVVSEGKDSLHHDTYRVFCLLAGLLLPAFGAIYRVSDPAALDPMTARLGVGILTLVFLSLSYMNAWVKAHFIRLVQGLFYLITAYIICLTAVNAFSPNYALGALFTMTGIGVAFSMGLNEFRPLVMYLSTAVAMCILAVWMVPRPSVSPAIMSISVISTALVIYVATRAKVSAEEATAATEKRYKTLVDSASDAIFVADAEADMLVGANRKAQELLGRSLDEIRRMRPRELFPAGSGADDWERFEKHIHEGQPLGEKLALSTSSGECIPVDVSASLTKVGDRVLIQGIFRDATKQQHYEQQLIEAKERAEELLELKSSFLNNMSHELRTPLTSILGFAEVLIEKCKGESEEFASHVARSARRLQGTLDSVLDLAQLESGKTELKLQPLDLGEEVISSVELLEGISKQKDLKLETVVSEAPTRVLADTSFINRIVNNLVGNAIKFTNEGGVVVEVGTDAEAVFLRVTDTGVGIDPDFQEYLFDEFRQGSTGLRRTHEGNGLGLAITKRLVDLLGGTIEVESQKEVGSTFTVSLPPAPEHEAQETHSRSSSVADAGELVSQEVPAPPSAAQEAQRRVLVVEDNPSTQRLIEYQLSKICAFEQVTTPDEALDLASQQSFDAFLLDIHLGADMNGIDVLHMLRSKPEYRNVPAIALTAHALPADRERFLKAGFNDHLPKPFTASELLHALEELVWPTVPLALS